MIVMPDQRESDVEPRNLYPSKGRTLGLVALCLIFVAVGSGMLAEGDAVMGGIALAFFGLGAAALGATLLPGASSLRLDAEGLEIRSLFRSHRFSWREVRGFRPVSLPPSGTTLVGFDFAPNARPAAAWLSSSLAGVDGALPSTYGLSATELAEMLNRWQARCTGGERTSEPVARGDQLT